ncbi:MAG: methyltransferase [Pararhodobacter sp.]|nr:methyltransferase [Pararhodobacter sp.]
MSAPAQSLQAGDTARFLRAWLADPLAIAAVAPSGRTLARMMTAGIGPETGPVIELGPGTGVFTRALLSRRVAPDNLLLIERSPAFTLLLRERFPDLDIVCDFAQRLDDHARARLPDAPGAIVSGLPLLAMSRSDQREILNAAFSAMRSGGSFIQFTYGHVPPVDKGVARGLGLRFDCLGRTLRNLPPASVYSIRRIAT